MNMAMQYAATGNAHASFTAYSLVMKSGGRILLIDESLHAPIEQALAVVRNSKKQDLAQRYVQFVLGPDGQAALRRSGYSVPSHMVNTPELSGK